MMQQYNNPKHCQHNKWVKWKVLYCPSQSPDISMYFTSWWGEWSEKQQRKAAVVETWESITSDKCKSLGDVADLVGVVRLANGICYGLAAVYKFILTSWLMHLSMDCRRKPEHLEETRTGTEKTCKVYTDKPLKPRAFQTQNMLYYEPLCWSIGRLLSHL